MQESERTQFHRAVKSFFDLPRLNDEVWFLLERLQYETGDRKPFLPELSETDLNIDSLRAAWLHPAQIREFAAVSEHLQLDHVRVVRAVGPQGECGFCYRPDEYRALGGTLLVAINDAVIPEGHSLTEILLHEVAHSASVSADHDWHFLVHLNLLRMEVGFGPTMDEYDCRDEVCFYGISPSEVLRLAAETAKDLRSKCDLQIALSLARTTPRPYWNS